MSRKPRHGTYKRKTTERDEIIIRTAFLLRGSATAKEVHDEAVNLGMTPRHPRMIVHVLRDAAVRRTLVTVRRPGVPAHWNTTQQSWLYYAR